MAAAIASKGYDVIGVDLNPEVVDALATGKTPVFEPGLQELLGEHHDRIAATSSYETAIEASDITFVVVATPSDDSGGFSLRYVLPVCESIGRELAKKQTYHLVVMTSTVLPGAMENEIRPALEAASGKRIGSDVGLCYSPEFIALGSVIRDLLNPDFALIGENDARAGDLLEEFYRSIHEREAHIARMNLVNAEITKLAVNTYVTTKISFANMLAGICERMPRADVDVVTSAIGHDRRIGHLYLRGALGYGGPCFPRDNVALTYLARTLGAPAELAAATDALNKDQIPHLMDVVRSKLVPGGTVAVLGLSYKPDTDVVAESQGLMLAKALLEEGISVVAYDPAALENSRTALSGATFARDASEAVSAADVVVVTTPWREFKTLGASPGLSERSSRKVVVDCWRILDRHSLGDSVEYVALGIGVGG